MKVIYLTAIKEWLSNKYNFGFNIWKELAEEMGIGVDSFRNQDNYISFQRLKSIFEIMSKKLKKSEFDVRSDFVQYWLTDFAPRLCQSLARKATTIKEFLVNYVKLNNDLCQFIPNNSYILKIDLKEIDRNTMTAVYGNEKSLIDIIGLLRGISTYYKEQYNIKKINPHCIEIRFER